MGGEIGPFLVPVAFFAFLAVGAMALSPIWRAVARRMEHRAMAADPSRAELSERMERMEQALEAVAIQVERIAEGQRFTTKLLSDRVSDARALTSSEHGSEV
ncbi:MAG: hypothetical protein ACREOG_14490 [Gemmatimonadaceae bacterium]